MTEIKAYGAQARDAAIAPMTIQRRAVTANDVAITILYCGICHSDIHQVRNDWGKTHYPIVPGHEIIGRVSAVGDQVERYQVGDIVGVGCMVNACRQCDSCESHLEQYCQQGFIGTYNAEDRYHGGITYGGYAENIVVDQDFVLRIPDALPTATVAPLLCAGITTYSPLRHWRVQAGHKVGIIGLGGLGHMGVKLACAMGAEVTVLTSSLNKIADARQLGAAHVLLSHDEQAMQDYAGYFDFLLNTVPVHHDLNPYFGLLKRDATMVIVGAIEAFTSGELHGLSLIKQRRCVAGSLIGGIQETQEMLDFCAKHQVLPEVEMVKPQEINKAYERMLNNAIKYRFVIDFSDVH